MKRDRQPQIENLLGAIKKFIDAGNFRFSEHAVGRGKERSISPQDALDVLANGFHERSKTAFDPIFKQWKYAIRGKTLDNKNVRVIVAIVDELIIITVIRIT